MNLNFNQLKYIYNEYLKTEYSSLSYIKKILFLNEEEYSETQFNFKQKLFLFKLNFSIASLYLGSLSFLIHTYITPYIINKRRIWLKSKLPVCFLSICLSFKIFSDYYPIDISNLVNPYTKFGIFCWFEINFRNNQLAFHLDYLDSIISNELDMFIKSDLKNIDKLDLILFYQDAKSHFINLQVINNMLTNINGQIFLDYMKTYKFSNKLHSNRYLNLQNIKLIQEKRKLKIPILTHENYLEYFYDLDILAIKYQEELKQKILENL